MLSCGFLTVRPAPMPGPFLPPQPYERHPPRNLAAAAAFDRLSRQTRSLPSPVAAPSPCLGAIGKALRLGGSVSQQPASPQRHRGTITLVLVVAFPSLSLLRLLSERREFGKQRPLTNEEPKS